MARCLFVVPPLTGHINPLLSVARELQQRGHEVAWAGYEDTLSQHLEASAIRFILPILDDAGVAEKTQTVRGLDSIRFFYEAFCFPLAELALQPLEQVVDEYRPDIMVCDHQMLAGALVARKLNLPWISSVTTSASILQPHVVLQQWLDAKFEAIQQRVGLEPAVSRPDFSPYSCMVFSSEVLLGSEFELIPAPYHFVGPSINPVRKAIAFPWDALDPDKTKILISLGTVSRDRSSAFYQVMKEALADMPVQVIMVAPPEQAENAPNNFIVCERVPQLELLPEIDLVVSHAGHNTVCETLSQGKPMMLAPIRDDQPIVARQVVNAGAGLSVRFGKLTAATARKTVERLLTEARFREGAEAVQASFGPLNGATLAAEQIQSVLSDNVNQTHAGCSA